MTCNTKFVPGVYSPSIWTMHTSSWGRQSVVEIHVWMSYAEILGLLMSNEHTTVCCLSSILHFTWHCTLLIKLFLFTTYECLHCTSCASYVASTGTKQPLAYAAGNRLRIRSPDLPVRTQSLYRLSYLVHVFLYIVFIYLGGRGDFFKFRTALILMFRSEKVAYCLVLCGTWHNLTWVLLQSLQYFNIWVWSVLSQEKMVFQYHCGCYLKTSMGKPVCYLDRWL
jgi:hypothetical protein